MADPRARARQLDRERPSAASFGIWIAFGADYIVSIYLATERVTYVRRHLPDLVLLALPMFRPLRTLRAVMALGRVNRQATTSFRGRAAVYIGGTAPLLVCVTALAILDAEPVDPDANITRVADAMSWGSTAISTVGYGDNFPSRARA